MSDRLAVLCDSQPGHDMAVEYLRDGKRHTVQVHLGDYPCPVTG